LSTGISGFHRASTAANVSCRKTTPQPDSVDNPTTFNRRAIRVHAPASATRAFGCRLAAGA